ncbi:hypothetical protein AAZX31_08G224900 [Glycine max]|uniref:Knottin scorpion toxin-like domain-containing protein n=2 Tax=Glycine subgen. Soja TaxID=1462606 RepID=A0A0R0IWD2_SOYBN|nr:hypothetical protein JHK87_022067 [Glycine soja]KAG5016487.1 hypothetical protein JHK85_022623 [Glycine max]KAG5000996.1 hypothetical protein JHK87_022068 [Glycine soja]KAG5026256.1 hypothetical protein JHK86_022170 [Glycine max]KAG5137411.1 hypothetical protein JHK82_022142 [Glycine max]
MKDITFVFIVLLVLSIGIENEGPLKLIEARTCEETLYEFSCVSNKCGTDCRNKHGNFASGDCNAIEDCICRYPC